MDNEYKPYVFAGSSAFLIRAWIRNDFRESPEELTKLTLEALRIPYP